MGQSTNGGEVDVAQNRRLKVSLTVLVLILAVAALATFALPGGGSGAAEQAKVAPDARTVVVAVPVHGMACISCAATGRRAINSIDGVTHTQVDLGERLVRISYIDGRTTSEQIVERISRMGYRVGAPVVE